MAGTFEGWTEGMVLSILFIIIFGGIVVVGMNNTYNQSYEVEGLRTDDIQQKFEDYQGSMKEKIEGGEASFSTGVVGLTLSTSWNILTSIFSMILFFLFGGWIETIVAYMQLPVIVGIMIRGLYVVALGFIVLRVLFKSRV